ncbi:MAG: hypothetical protein KYX68_00980 [Flavobacterium sp.]|nr:hypothetical protein [Flavobacterium sp.]
MKIIILVLILGISNLGFSQFKLFQQYYFDCENGSYEMNQAISYSSYEGNYEKAKALLEKQDFFKNNSNEKLKIEALLAFNLFGEKKSNEIIEASDLSKENKDFTKLWVAFYTDIKKYNKQVTVFRAIYPNNYEVLKLKMRKIINYRDKNMHNEIKEDKPKSIATIDSLLNLNTLNPQNKLYFSLLKIDFQSKNDFRDTEKEVSEKKLRNDLLDLYEVYKEYFSPHQLLKILKNCDNSKCNQVKKEAAEKISKQNISSSTELALGHLMNYNNSEGKVSISDLQNTINTILANEKDATEKEQVNALLVVFSLDEEPNLGFMMKGLLKPIKFTNDFKSKIQINKSKEEILASIKNLLLDKSSTSIGSHISTENIDQELDQMRQLSTPDIKAFYGLTIFSQYYAKLFLKMSEESFAVFQTSPKGDELHSIDLYCKFLTNNPLYSETGKYIMKFCRVNSSAELLGLSNNLIEVKKKFPASKAVQKNIIASFIGNKEFINVENRDAVYKNFVETLIEFIKEPNALQKEKTDGLSYIYSLNLSEDEIFPDYDNLLKKFYEALSPNSRKEIEKIIVKAADENTENKSLQELKKEFLKAKNTKL